jgi:hypothetical protein
MVYIYIYICILLYNAAYTCLYLNICKALMGDVFLQDIIIQFFLIGMNTVRTLVKALLC